MKASASMSEWQSGSEYALYTDNHTYSVSSTTQGQQASGSRPAPHSLVLQGGTATGPSVALSGPGGAQGGFPGF